MIDGIDSRSTARWRALYTLPELFAGDGRYRRARAGGRYVLALRCAHCAARYLAATPVSMTQPCPACGGRLERRQSLVWDLVEQASPPWWDAERRP
jgi:hypothetical protein